MWLEDLTENDFVAVGLLSALITALRYLGDCTTFTTSLHVIPYPLCHYVIRYYANQTVDPQCVKARTPSAGDGRALFMGPDEL